MILIEPIDATISWENYEYQGHIALYIALKKYMAGVINLKQNDKFYKYNQVGQSFNVKEEIYG